MKKLNKVVEDVENSLERLVEEAEKPLKGILQFVKNHKKLILTLGVVYFVYNYLFADDVEEE